MGNCNWYGCNVVPETNPKTGKSYHHCMEHRVLTRPSKRAAYYKNREQRIGWTLNKWRRLRSNFLEMYGGKCICCHIDEEVFLALDHIENDGKTHRKTRGSFGVYEDATSVYNPTRFQILCHNCNFAKYQNGTCPHQLVGQEKTNGQ